jgi:hypothetical protein
LRIIARVNTSTNSCNDIGCFALRSDKPTDMLHKVLGCCSYFSSIDHCTAHLP